MASKTAGGFCVFCPFVINLAHKGGEKPPAIDVP
jgi:hypothetical protein